MSLAHSFHILSLRLTAPALTYWMCFCSCRAEQVKKKNASSELQQLFSKVIDYT